MNRTLPVALLALAVATACGQTTDGGNGDSTGGGAQGAGLDGRVFLSTEVTQAGKPRELVDGTTVRLTFTGDGQLIAEAGCNTMQGPVRVTEDKLGVSDLTTTGMGCDAARHEQDTWLADFLGAAPTMNIDGSTLTLTAGDRVIVLLDREVAQPDAALEGPTWVVDTLISGQTASSLPTGVSATLVFEAGSVQVNTGCNTGGASYTLDGATLVFSDLFVTRMACSADIMQVEATVTATLTGEATFTIEAERLTITHPDGTGLQLAAQP